MQQIKRFLSYLYSAWALIYFFVLALTALVFYLMISWLPSRPRLLWIYRYNWLWLTMWCVGTGVRVKVIGKRYLDPKETYVFVANHSNMLDILVAGGRIVHPFRPLIKKELLKVPIMGWVLRAMSLPVDRSSDLSRRESFRTMVETIQSNISMLIFPEGTRNRTDEPLKSFYNGAFRLAIKTQKPILPVLLQNIRTLQPVDTYLLRPGTITLKYLQPISTEGLTEADVKKLKQETFDIMYQGLEAKVISTST